MMWSAFLTMAALHWVVLVTPGVNFVLIGQLAVDGQRDRAVAAALGVSSMTLLWALLSVLGMGVVFAAHPDLRQLLQLAGGAYLCYLAWKLWTNPPAGTTEAMAHLPSRVAAFRRGFVTNALNPKPALFFGSVFATAVPPAAGWTWMVAAVALVYANALVWHMLLALAFSHAAVLRRYARQRARLNRLSAVVLGVFGARLIAETVQALRARLAPSLA
ncbi:LysE family translocator [Ottowia testudinis]|uniref:LysE family translocator n=1 Tax=Ottowia testudinis TaxID=2816950 RepID=A0A975H2L5_9BURK|nr:LysE family translocator [Ottowia testudinis]QTD44914.1 LysE family translocator [Ottowia testudinis]